jgi:ribose-phosphate pyrophosphokinase
MERLAASDLVEIVVTDTVPVNPLERPEKLTVLSVSTILAQSIQNVFSDESVSAIFAGQNQLF